MPTATSSVSKGQCKRRVIRGWRYFSHQIEHHKLLLRNIRKSTIFRSCQQRFLSIYARSCGRETRKDKLIIGFTTKTNIKVPALPKQCYLLANRNVPQEGIDILKENQAEIHSYSRHCGGLKWLCFPPDIHQTDDSITKWEGWKYPELLQDETPTLNEKLLKENLVEGAFSNSAISWHSSRWKGTATSTTSCSPFQLPISKKV